MWLRVVRRLAAARSGVPWPGLGLLKDCGPSARSPVLSRPRISKPSGAIMPRPVTMPFGLLRVLSFVITFICFGNVLGKTFAAFLDKHSVTLNPELTEDNF